MQNLVRNQDNIDRGHEQGDQSRAIENAKTMFADKLPLEVVTKYSGLSLEQVSDLMEQ